MRVIRSAERVQSVFWDFAKDGGAVASIDTKLVLPPNCIVDDIIVEVVDTITDSGGGLAVLNIGYAGTIDYYFGIGVTSPLARIGSYNVGASGLRQCVSPGGAILFSISGEALTTGSAKFHFIYIDSSI